MIAPLPDLLAAADPFLPPELVSPEARHRLAALAARIPSHWASVAIECRLTADARTDLIICATEGDGGQRLLAPLVRDGRARFGSSQRIVEAWIDETHPLSTALPVLWLEYDLDTPERDAAPDPFSFVCLWQDWLGPVYPRAPRGPPPDPRVTRSLAASGLAATTGRPPTPGAMDVLEHCAARLPMHGRLIHAVQRPRPGSDDVRVGAILPTEHVRSWLAAIGWSGAAESVDRLLRLVGPGWSMLHVQVEFGPDGVRPLLSIDYNRGGTEDWDRLAAALVAEGAALPQKAAAVRRWIGSSAFVGPQAEWKAIAERRAFDKLTIRADGTLEAKAYLCIQARYVLF